jgi:hypothetical protein
VELSTFFIVFASLDRFNMYNTNELALFRLGIFKLRVTRRRAGKERCIPCHDEEKNVVHIFLQMKRDIVTDRKLFDL